MQSLGDVAAAVILILLLLLAAKGLRKSLPFCDRFFLPTSLIAGIMALCLGAQVAGRLYPEGTLLSHGIFPESMLEVWRQMPGILVTFLFAGLFIGKRFPSPLQMWRMGGPQAMLGFAISFGQYALGLLVTLLILVPFFNVNPLYAALIEIGFSGGHGTAAGFSETFSALNFKEGQDLALGMATVGLISGLISGVIFINWAVRSNLITIAREEPVTPAEHHEFSALQANEGEMPGTPPGISADPLTLHLALIAAAIVIGQLLRVGLIAFERYTYGPITGQIMAHVPLFPMAMIGGVILQGILTFNNKSRHISRELINRISGLCLDFIIVTSLATLSLSSIAQNWAPFVFLALTGMAWSVFCFRVLAPRMLPEYWFERGIGDFGQGNGMFASGLLLMHVADPKDRSGALERFGCKQLVFQPLLGGGLITALFLPFCIRFGTLSLLLIFSFAALLAVGFGIRFFGPSSKIPGA